VKIGVGIESGDRLLVRSFLDAVDLTRMIVDEAYRSGAENVDVLWSDDHIGRARFAHGPDSAADSVSGASDWLRRSVETGDHVLTVVSTDPNALADVDVERVARFRKANFEAAEPFFDAMGRLSFKWSIICTPNLAWARSVFPGSPGEEAVELLWSAIFRTCRIDNDDPLTAWAEHIADLNAREAHLNEKQYVGLRYDGPGTDLTVSFPEGHHWEGGNPNVSATFLPNIPTEEVFGAPHVDRVDGVVTATKPLSILGNLVEGFRFEVEGGRIVDASAERGQSALEQLLRTDEGSARFGEVAMVPVSGAVAREGLIWNNPLFDENDGCHIAIGNAYPTSLEGGSAMTKVELAAAGLNQSSVHEDFVVGSPEVSVYGIRGDGGEEPIISKGEWGFSV
jgi:aminopeptidase